MLLRRLALVLGSCQQQLKCFKKGVEMKCPVFSSFWGDKNKRNKLGRRGKTGRNHLSLLKLSWHWVDLDQKVQFMVAQTLDECQSLNTVLFLSPHFWKIFTCLHFLYPKLSYSSTMLLLQRWSFDGVGEENPSLILLLLQDTTSAC